MAVTNPRRHEDGPLRFALIGAGVIGQLRARSIRENPGAQLVAVADPASGAAEALASRFGARAYPDHGAVLDAGGVDALVVSTPVHHHEEACVAGLRAGCHVLCEKPLSNTVESCRRIVEAAQHAGRVLAVGFNVRYYPAIRFVKETIDGGVIGELDHLRVFGGHDGLSNFRADWQYKAPDSGGGAMMDVGIHLTDAARYLLGEITDVYGVMSESVWKVPGSEDNAIAVLRNPAGISASYHATWTEWKGYRFCVEAYGSLGMVRGSYAPMSNLLITQGRPGGPRTTRRLFYPWIMAREKILSWHSTALLSFAAELRDLLRMTEGDDAVPLADGYAGLRAVEVAAAVRESSATGHVVRLPALGRMRS